MSKKKTIAIIAGATALTAGITALVMKKKAEKTSYKAELIDGIQPRKMGIYEKYIKRAFDIICAFSAILVFAPLYIIVAILVKLKLGSPVLFTQDRPGLIGPDGKETVFKMYKFRTMTDERDENGNLLPDSIRLTKFGAWLRSTSLDELPEAFNILNGTMSVIGPRPQLVRDMVFMTPEQRQRHTAKPGLSGLAQVNGRNAISWEDKLSWDLKYIEHISFIGDIRIILQTVIKAFVKQEGITEEDMATAEDFGDYLLRTEKVEQRVYAGMQVTAKRILAKEEWQIDTSSISQEKHQPFSVAMSVYKNDNSVYFDRALQSITELQTIKPDEVVLVVDGPVSKELDDVIEKYVEGYNFFNVIRLKENGGLGNALKIAVENAKYEIIARMDSDDVSVETRFAEQLAFFEHNAEIDIVGGNITEFIDDENNIVGTRVVPKTDVEIREYMKERCAMNHVSVMFKKTAVLAAGGYQDWFWNEDYYLWIRMWLNSARFANTGTVLVNVRVGKEMYQRRGGKKYFTSEYDLQKYMLDNDMISKELFVKNVAKRVIVQRLLPNRVRAFVFKKFARN